MRVPKLTSSLEEKLLLFVDELRCGESDVYAAWVRAGIANSHFQVQFNGWAKKEFGGRVAATGSSGLPRQFIGLAHRVVMESRGEYVADKRPRAAVISLSERSASL